MPDGPRTLPRTAKVELVKCLRDTVRFILVLRLQDTAEIQGVLGDSARPVRFLASRVASSAGLPRPPGPRLAAIAEQRRQIPRPPPAARAGAGRPQPGDGVPSATRVPPALGPREDRFSRKKAAKIGGQCFAAFVPFPRLFLQAFQADGFQIARQIRIEAAGRPRFVLHDSQHGLHRIAGIDRRLPREQFVQMTAQHRDPRAVRQTFSTGQWYSLFYASIGS